MTNEDDFNYIDNELDSKLEIYHKVAVYEVAYRKIKEVEFLISDPFFSSRPPRNYRKLVYELVVDSGRLQSTEDIQKFIVKFEGRIEELQEIEERLEEIQKTRVCDALKTIIFWGIPLLFSFYGLVAVGYFTIDFYTPIIFYIFLSCVTYFLLKSGINLKIIHLAYKNKTFKFKKLELLIFIPILLTISMGLTSIVKNPPKVNDSKISLFGYFLIILGFVLFMILLSHFPQ